MRVRETRRKGNKNQGRIDQVKNVMVRVLMRKLQGAMKRSTAEKCIGDRVEEEGVNKSDMSERARLKIVMGRVRAERLRVEMVR